MIFKQKFYRSIDHWSDISLFYFQRGISWSRFKQFSIKDSICIADFKKAQIYLRKEHKPVLNTDPPSNYFSTESVYISTPETLEVVYNKELQAKSQAPNVVKHLGLCINLETLHMLKDYMFESGIYKTIVKAVNNSINQNNELQVCVACRAQLNGLFYSYNSLADFDTIFTVSGKIASCTAPDYPISCVNVINSIISKALTSRDMTISKLLQDLGLRIKGSSENFKTSDYSEDFSIAFYDRPQPTGDSTYKIILSNSKKEFLIYTENGIRCPYNHYNESKGYKEKCKAEIPGDEDPITLHSIEYINRHTHVGTQFIISDPAIFDSSFKDIATIQLNSNLDIFCRSNTKKISIDRSILEKANVRQYIRRK